MILMLVAASSACAEAVPGLEDGVLTVAMECAYAPYNWAQPDDSNDAVPIKDSLLYANGYDVMTAKAICEANGWELEILQLDWDSLIPSLNAGAIDCIIAGMTETPERAEAVNFTTPYYESQMVVIVRKDSDLVGINDIQQLRDRIIRG